MTQRITETEWEFSKIPAGEFAACFWWEYARSSPGVSRAVRNIASNSEEQEHAAMNSAAADMLTNPVLGALWTINTLAGNEVFPAMDWLHARAQKLKSVTVGDIWMNALELSAKPLRVAGPTIAVNATRMAPTSYGADVTLPILGGSPKTHGRSRSSFLSTVDWQFSDEQIVEAFRLELLKLRPGAHPRPRRAATASPSGISSKFTYAAALGWLSVWRRKQNCSWTEFVALYARDFQKHTGGMPDLRELKSRYQKAVRLLKQFE